MTFWCGSESPDSYLRIRIQIQLQIRLLFLQWLSECKKKISYHLATGTSSSVLKINFLLKFCVKILLCGHYFSPPNTFMRKGKDPESGSVPVPLTNGSRSLLPKNMRIRFRVRIPNTELYIDPQASIKDGQTKGEAYILQKRTSSTSKQYISSVVLLVLFDHLDMVPRIPNADPCGHGSAPQHWLPPIVFATITLSQSPYISRSFVVDPHSLYVDLGLDPTISVLKLNLVIVWPIIDLDLLGEF